MTEQREVEVQPTWWLSLRFWWAFMWRLFSFNLLVVGFYMLAFRLVGGYNELLDNGLAAISAVLFFILEIWLMRSLLSRRFGRFRVAVFELKD
jgi:hypothetical protein